MKNRLRHSLDWLEEWKNLIANFNMKKISSIFFFFFFLNKLQKHESISFLSQ